jgi:hypothetical protein
MKKIVNLNTVILIFVVVLVTSGCVKHKVYKNLEGTYTTTSNDGLDSHTITFVNEKNRMCTYVFAPSTGTSTILEGQYDYDTKTKNLILTNQMSLELGELHFEQEELSNVLYGVWTKQ